MSKHLLLVPIIASTLVSIAVFGETNKWDIAESQIERLSPDIFTELPSIVKKDLKNNGCKIPQTFLSNPKHLINNTSIGPHNVISGSFEKQGQIDWAVLCSVKGVSTIRVYWEGNLDRLVEIEPSSDKNWLQGIGHGEIGYSRYIGKVGKNYIMERYKRYGGAKPPTIDHEGINDAFTEKGSEVHYYYKGSWLRLTGAD